MKISVGCPIYNRAWSLPRWFQNLFNQKIDLKQTSLVFAYTPGDDNTLEIIEQYGSKFSELHVLPCEDLPAFANRDNARYYPLVILRNRIFEKLREIQPDYYFSWDSDILLPEGTLKGLIKDKKDIVGPWVDLVPPNGIPNCVTLLPNGGGFRRRKPYDTYYPQTGLYEVSTVFAVSLMSSPVFNTCTYMHHQGGEDYGFAINVINAGFTSWMDANFIGTHLYNKDA
jgi:glycosyltransferase involved in cell wall biosynthesis